jgi:hypothetical protein
MFGFVPSAPVDHDVAVHETVPSQVTDAAMLEWWALAIPLNSGITEIAPRKRKIAERSRRRLLISISLLRPATGRGWVRC